MVSRRNNWLAQMVSAEELNLRRGQTGTIGSEARSKAMLEIFKPLQDPEHFIYMYREYYKASMDTGPEPRPPYSRRHLTAVNRTYGFLYSY